LIDSDRLILQCVDFALSSLDFADNKSFYQLLEKSGIRNKEISSNFEAFHQIIKQLFGANHYQIERLMIKFLHEQAPASFKHSTQIEAFFLMTNVFSEDIKESIERNKELANSESHVKYLEEKVKLADEKLKSAERMVAIGETAAMVGHDIRNPLQAIAGDLFLMDNDVASLPEGEVKKSLQESLISVQGNLQYIEKIILDLQDYAKPLRPSVEKVVFAKVIEDVFLTVPIENNLDVAIDVEKGFPVLFTDFTMLERVLCNLVNNAAQAMPRGGKLTVKAYRGNDSVFVAVEDTGGGIPEEIKAKLFKPMVTSKAKGQGFGLAVVKRLVDGLNGKISFESTNGKGTKFLIELPIKVREQAIMQKQGP